MVAPSTSLVIVTWLVVLSKAHQQVYFQQLTELGDHGDDNRPGINPHGQIFHQNNQNRDRQMDIRVLSCPSYSEDNRRERDDVEQTAKVLYLEIYR